MQNFLSMILDDNVPDHQAVQFLAASLRGRRQRLSDVHAEAVPLCLHVSKCAVPKIRTTKKTVIIHYRHVDS